MPRWRYLAQDVLTGTWLDFDLPLVRSGEQPRWELSGPGSLSGSISGDHPTLRDGGGYTVLREWSTLLYAEQDGRIAWCGIIQHSDFNGGEWTVQAFGMTSYAVGIPYTGEYRKLVDVDPGLIWSTLWTHIQSQPDGNLSLKTVVAGQNSAATMQLGPNIGTKDEPYELSWWEAKDCGEELQTLASEAPFDYVESHRWIGDAPSTSGLTPAVGERLSFEIGCGNFEGGYTATDRGGWKTKRAEGQAEYFLTLGLDMFVATELHEDTSPTMPQGADAYWLGLLRLRGGPDWAEARGYRGNQFIYRQSTVKVWAVENQRVADPTGLGKQLRATSAWYVTHLPTGLTGWVFGGHFRVDQHGQDLEPVRRAEASNMAAWANLHTYKPDGLPASVPSPMFRIVCGDWNSTDHTPQAPMWRFDQAGYLDMKTRADGPVPYGDIASRSGAKTGRWIDNILTRNDEVTITDVAGIPTLKLSDHALWVRCRIVPRATVNVAALRPLPTPQVEHTVTLSYPRAGRRRFDLRFVQGDNIVETVAAVRDGEEFSNDVITLGKGEGKKTLRGESVVRDGRLRRPKVYTDKLASTSKRCDALALRERSWRTLQPLVESVVVADHANAPIGSWQLGDDVRIEVHDAPHLGAIDDWYRVVAWALVTDTTARLTLSRSDAFTYGPFVPPDAEDFAPLEDPDSDDDEIGS